MIIIYHESTARRVLSDGGNHRNDTTDSIVEHNEKDTTVTTYGYARKGRDVAHTLRRSDRATAPVYKLHVRDVSPRARDPRPLDGQLHLE
jgi:hypothetical protein